MTQRFPKRFFGSVSTGFVLFSLFVCVFLMNTASAMELVEEQLSAQAATHPTSHLKTKTPPRKVVVSIEPYALILKSIIRENDHVEVLLEAGASPHDFQLRPSHLKAIQGADLVVWGGEQLEPFLVKTLDRLKGQKPKSLKLMSLEGLDLIELGSHGHGHHHGNLEPHIWYSKHNANLIAAAMAAALQYPDEALKAFRANASADANQSSGSVGKHSLRSLVVFHDAYSYLEKGLGVKHDFVIRENHNTRASLAHWAKFDKHLALLKEKGQSLCIVAEPGYDLSPESKQVERLINKSGMQMRSRFVQLDPLASDKAYKDYWTFLQDSENRLKACLEP